MPRPRLPAHTRAHIRDPLETLTRCSNPDALAIDEILVSRAVRRPAPNLCNVVLRTSYADIHSACGGRQFSKGAFFFEDDQFQHRSRGPMIGSRGPDCCCLVLAWRPTAILREHRSGSLKICV